MEEDLHVIVDPARYEDLLATEGRYELLQDMLLETAELSYTKKGLTFSDEIINAFLKIEKPYNWNNKLAKLRIEAGLAPDTTTIKVDDDEQS